MPKPYTPNDKWSQKATDEGYRARSVYKLQELDDRCKLIKPGMNVVDLGAAPGSWLQYVAQKVKKGKLIGIDLQEMEPIEGVALYQEDITDTDAVKKILETEGVESIDLLLSDLAPKTSGIKDIDQWKSIELSQAVIDIAKLYLSPKGTCVMKVLRGSDFDDFLRELKGKWTDVKTMQVKASRDRSKEIYVIIK